MSLISQARAKLSSSADNSPTKETAQPVHSSLTRTTVSTKATLSDGTTTVEFQFNPDTIKIGHSPDTKPMNRSMGKPGTESKATIVGNPNEVIMNAGEASISFGDLLFDGPDVAEDCAKLLQWTYPIKDTNPDPTPAKLPKNASGHTVAPPKATGKTPGSHPLPPPMIMPLLTFSWNKFDPGLKFVNPSGQAVLVLAKVDVSYIRFDAEGKATRAKVTLGCKIPPSALKGTNPTSGGRPDRRGHLVTAGEDLPSIARANYGSPAYWRHLAELNRVDDPLRVRPGDRLYVPAFAELRGGSA
jgi:nucleoid-associated protein YgaU